MEDADAPGSVEPFDHLQDRIDGFASRQRAAGADAFLQSAAGDEFHGNGGGAGDLLSAKDIDAIGMVDGSGQAAFAKESLAGIG